MKYLAILSTVLLLVAREFAEARIGSEKILAHTEAKEIVDVVQDHSQLAHRELKVCRRVSDERSIFGLRFCLSRSLPFR